MRTGQPKTAPTVYYFGCIRESGHYLWPNPHNRTWDVDVTPWGTQLDGKLCPAADPWMKGGQPQGLAALHHKDGWTAVAFWDRSVDTRPGSNSVFLADRTLDFEEMVGLSKQRFPSVWQRLGFDVSLANHPSPSKANPS